MPSLHLPIYFRPIQIYHRELRSAEQWMQCDVATRRQIHSNNIFGTQYDWFKQSLLSLQIETFINWTPYDNVDYIYIFVKRIILRGYQLLSERIVFHIKFPSTGVCHGFARSGWASCRSTLYREPLPFSPRVDFALTGVSIGSGF